MKRTLYILFLFFIATFAKGQNLVPNGDFENYSSCPTGPAQMNRCVGWSAYYSTPDYMHTCNAPSYNPGSNTFGSQTPASGNGIGGIWAKPFKEKMICTITPMTIGNWYEVSMSVSLGDNCGIATDDLGVHFFDNGSSTTTTQYQYINQVSYSSYGAITNKTGWTRVVALFYADSAYDNMVVGAFKHDTSTVTANTPPGSLSTFYYIDSVVVKLASGITNLFTDSLLCAGDTFQVPYTLTSFATFTSTNVFTAQLSGITGSFNSGTTTIGTRTGNTNGNITCVIPSSVTPGNNYRIRILASNVVDSSPQSTYPISIGVVKPAKPVASNNSPICTTDTLELYANSTTSGVSYKWTGPASFTSLLQYPVIPGVTVANSGAYIVAARLYGCISKDTTIANVSSVTASFITASANTPICERDTLKLTGTVLASPNSYSWTGPNNFTSSHRDTNVLNATPVMSGNYILTANYTGCSITDTVTVLINPLAANRTIGSNSPVCSGNTLNLSGSSSSSGVGYIWTGPGSYVTTSQNPFIANAATANSGNYVLTYILNGCMVKDSIAVTVNPTPITPIATTNAPVCQNDTLKLFSTNSSSNVTWNWTGPNSFTSSVQNPMILNSTSAATGDYIVTVSLSNGCDRKDTITALVKPLPANVSNSNNGPLCVGSTLILLGSTTSSGVTWSWTGPNSFTSSLQNPGITSVTTAANGDYIATATLNGCIVNDTTTVVINLIPPAPSATTNTPVCVGQDLKLNAATLFGVSYAWNGPASYSSNTQNPIRNSATTAMAGIYSVTATANNCTSSPATVNVNVLPAPDVSVYPSPKDSICQGATLTLVSTVSNAGSSPSYQWYRNNALISGAISKNYSTTTAADFDAYYCIMNVTGVCYDPYRDTSNAMTIRVFPWLVPSVSISANPSGTVSSGSMITFTAKPTNGGNIPLYQWKRNSANVIGAISNTWGAPTLSNKDVICVDMTSTYLCPNPAKVTSNCITVSIESNGVESFNNPNLKVYPNPANETLTIEGIEPNTKILLTDVFGRIVYATIGGGMVTIPTKDLVPGNYMLRLSNSLNSITVKVTKE